MMAAAESINLNALLIRSLNAKKVKQDFVFYNSITLVDS